MPATLLLFIALAVFAVYIVHVDGVSKRTPATPIDSGLADPPALPVADAHTKVDCYRLAACTVLEVTNTWPDYTATLIPTVASRPDGSELAGVDLDVVTVAFRGRNAAAVAALFADAETFNEPVDVAVEYAYLADGDVGVVATTVSMSNTPLKRAATVDPLPEPHMDPLL